MGSAAKAEIAPESPDSGDLPYLTETEFRARERQNLVAALRAANWRVWGPDGAAAMLGISPSTLSYRMNAFEIKRDQARY